jgi:hypothetical protein
MPNMPVTTPAQAVENVPSVRSRFIFMILFLCESSVSRKYSSDTSIDDCSSATCNAEGGEQHQKGFVRAQLTLFDEPRTGCKEIPR